MADFGCRINQVKSLSLLSALSVFFLNFCLRGEEVVLQHDNIFWCASNKVCEKYWICLMNTHKSGAHTNETAELQSPPPPSKIDIKMHTFFKRNYIKHFIWCNLHTNYATRAYIYMCINAVANSVLWHNFYNTVFKIKHKLYRSPTPPTLEKLWVRAWQ
jgi:hypothetical protein